MSLLQVQWDSYLFDFMRGEWLKVVYLYNCCGLRNNTKHKAREREGDRERIREKSIRNIEISR